MVRKIKLSESLLRNIVRESLRRMMYEDEMHGEDNPLNNGEEVVLYDAENDGYYDNFDYDDSEAPAMDDDEFGVFDED